ncbi:MAG: hypothetical protein FWF20_07115 [Betaproteobacteria bacterium]|nr:hypothetical protein [Betaproteobacteria bacterium]
MATLTGWLPDPSIFISVQPAHFSDDLDRFAGTVGFPFFSSTSPASQNDWTDATPSIGGQGFDYLWQSGPGLFSVLARNLPVAANGRPVGGHVALSYFDDYYNRIHLGPASVDVGNVVSTVTRQFYIWNANLVPRTLIAVDNIPSGVLLAPVDGSPLPSIYAALQEREWGLTVLSSGSSRIDSNIVFDFAESNDPILRLVGQRVIAWAWPPDWSEGISERLEWLTDVLVSRSGAEQRRALRIAPRRSFEARFVVEAGSFQNLGLMLAAWGANDWALPIWPDGQLLAANLAAEATAIPCATAYRDFQRGGMALLIPGDIDSAGPLTAEAVEVEAVSANQITLVRPTQNHWPAGSRLYPARAARLAETPTLARKTDRTATFSARFEVLDACDWPETSPADSYRGRPAFFERPNEVEDLSDSVARILSELDNQFGKRSRTDVAGVGFVTQSHRWFLHGPAARDGFRRLAYFLRGRQRSLWLPAWAESLTLDAPASGSVLRVKRCGYGRFGVGRLGLTDIAIELNNGLRLLRRITAASEDIELDQDVLAIEPPLQTAILPAEVARLHFLRAMRADADEVTIRHHDDLDGLAEAEIVFRGVRDDVL